MFIVCTLYANVHNQIIYEHKVITAYYTCSQKQKSDLCLGHLYTIVRLYCHTQRLTPWVGLRKINVSYWGWEDTSPFTASTLQWLPGEPSDSGFCAYLERAEVAGLKAKPCTANTEGLICEKPLGEYNYC